MKTSPFRRITTYAIETIDELKKCSWPNRQELARLTLSVITGFVLLAVFVVICDYVFQSVVRFLIQS